MRCCFFPLLIVLLLPVAVQAGEPPAEIVEEVFAPPPPVSFLDEGETGGLALPAAVVTAPPAPALPADNPPSDRLILDFLQSECAPLADSGKGFFATVLRSENPLLATCTDELSRFLDSCADSPEAGEALLLQASLYRQRKDFPREAVALARVLYLVDNATERETARNRLRQLASRELKGAKRGLDFLLEERRSVGAAPLERQLLLLQALARLEDRSLLPAVREEVERFLRRFPGAAGAETVLALRAENYGRAGEFAQQSFDLRRLVRLYPASSERPQRLLALGEVCSRELREYASALAAWDELLALYPDSAETPVALQRSAAVLAAELKRYPESQERLGRIAAQWPRTPAAAQALTYQAGLQARIGQEREAIATWQRLAAMFPASDVGMGALVSAAELAGQLRDYPLQVTLLDAVIRDYPGREQAWQAQFTRAQLLEERLGEREAAIAGYETLAGGAGGEKLAAQARRRITRLSPTGER